MHYPNQKYQIKFKNLPGLLVLLVLCAKSTEGESEDLGGLTRFQQTFGAEDDLSLGASGVGVGLGRREEATGLLPPNPGTGTGCVGWYEYDDGK